MLRIQASGRLVADPVQRTTVKGAAYATFGVRIQTNDGAGMTINCIAYAADVVVEVMRLGADDGVSVTGHGALRAYIGRDGNHKSSLCNSANGCTRRGSSRRR